MRYIMTLIWSLCLVSMLNYVVSSVLGSDFHFMTGIYLSFAMFVLVLVISAIIPSKPVMTVADEAEQH